MVMASVGPPRHARRRPRLPRPRAARTRAAHLDAPVKAIARSDVSERRGSTPRWLNVGVADKVMSSNVARREATLRSACVVLLVVLLAGCAHGVLDRSEIVSTGPATRVTFIRESRFIAGGSPAIITLDDKKVLALWSGEHATLPVRPGYRQICQRWTAGKGGVFYHCDTLWPVRRSGQIRHRDAQRPALFETYLQGVPTDVWGARPTRRPGA